MTQLRALRAAIVGYGFSGRRIHAPLLAALPGFDVSAFVVRSADARRIAALEHPDAVIFANLDELVEHAEDYDVVVVGTPDDSHFSIATTAIGAGLNVVIDKPFAQSSAEAEELFRAAEAKGVVITAFQNKRWDSDYATVAQVVRDGIIGDVTRYDSWITRWAPTVGTTWRDLSRPGTPDGRLADLGSHLVDQAVSLLGPVSLVYAELDQRRPGARANDDVFLALTHTNHARSHIHMGSVTSHATSTFQVQGLVGSIVTNGQDGQFMALINEVPPLDDRWRSFDTWSARLIANKTERSAPTLTASWLDFYVSLERSIRTGSPFPVEPHQVVHVLRVLEAAMVSHQTRQTVELASGM